jgi:molybdopterin-containing oxidoreductase family iron-sulfur binding subunit
MRAKTKAYAEERIDLEEGEYITACTEACPAQAITFGDLGNLDHEVTKLSKSPHAFRLLERLGSEPKVYYLSTKDWVRKMADNYRPGEFKPVSTANI